MRVNFNFFRNFSIRIWTEGNFNGPCHNESDDETTDPDKKKELLKSKSKFRKPAQVDFYGNRVSISYTYSNSVKRTGWNFRYVKIVSSCELSESYQLFKGKPVLFSSTKLIYGQISIWYERRDCHQPNKTLGYVSNPKQQTLLRDLLPRNAINFTFKTNFFTELNLSQAIKLIRHITLLSTKLYLRKFKFFQRGFPLPLNFTKRILSSQKTYLTKLKLTQNTSHKYSPKKIYFKFNPGTNPGSSVVLQIYALNMDEKTSENSTHKDTDDVRMDKEEEYIPQSFKKIKNDSRR